ncbi:protein-export chaperone SecB [Wenzhouxiangella marina]|uniref:Protein-export protein SecB n=1 Tax=Wenzhouxiangella marina TaxID=1579979 RepID=A0A0K0XWG2_9GAMM|nr:protein-export chaperone SecB [Wenzhouxiangella marina]AKS41972.1 Protein-export protein SecB [Wenzhouxiangella marina]MBB6086261.1 preprotein translocase subunit SecB [Wenzhouxiangella marina]
MAEENQGAAQGENAQSREAQMIVQHVFLKDASYEAKSPQELDGAEGQPDMNLSLSQRTNQLDDNRWEVILSVTVTAKQGENTAFLCEVQYGGIFQFAGFSEQQMPYVINVLCPNVLFPYNRTQISNMVAAGGYFMPPIQPVNFEAVFRQRLAEGQAGEQAGNA